MNILSLFGGRESGHKDIERLGIPVDKYFSSELDPYAIKITRANYPDIIHIGSVTDIMYKQNDGLYWSPITKDWLTTYAHDAVSIDLLIGGSPCQDLSIAKKNWKGLDWEKSWLFYEYVRILREVKPKYFLLENVASMKKSDKEKITEVLREVYPDTQVHMINSALVSAQNRKRLYWTNIPGVTQPEDKWILLRDILEDIPMDDKRWKPLDKKYLTDSFFEKIAKWTISLANIHPTRKAYPVTATYAWACPRDFLEKHQRELVIGQFRRWSNLRIHTDQDNSPTLTSNMGTGGNNVPVILWLAHRNRGEWKQPECNLQEKANSLTTVQSDSEVLACPRDYLEKHQRERVLWIYQIPRWKNNWGITYDWEKSPTITGSFADNSKLVWFRKLSRDEYEKSTTPPEWHKRPWNPHDNDWFDNKVEIIYLWRKLTPTECERLQTLPDNYTACVSNSRRYKAIGNGWTVDVIAHILSFIPLS